MSIEEADTAVRDRATDARRTVAAVDAVHRVVTAAVEVERAGAERVAGSTRKPACEPRVLYGSLRIVFLWSCVA